MESPDTGQPRPFQLVCAVPVPFLGNGDLDTAGLPALFAGLRAAGVEQVFAAGTTGEFTALSADERLRVIGAALEVFGPGGVYAHVGAATAREARGLARRAAALGATRFAAITPFFLPGNPAAVHQYYEAVAEEIGGGELFAYIFPARTTTEVSPEALAALGGIGPVRGAKVSGLPVSAVARYVSATPPGFRVFSGNDGDLFTLPKIGAAGLVSGVSSVFPAVFAQAVAAVGEDAAAAAYEPVIRQLVAATGAGNIGLLKAGLARGGLPAGPLRVSIDPPSPAALRELQRLVDETKPRTGART